MSAEQQLERPSRFKAGARMGPGEAGDGSHSSIAATALLGYRLQGRGKGSFKSNGFSMQGLWGLVPGHCPKSV